MIKPVLALLSFFFLLFSHITIAAQPSIEITQATANNAGRNDQAGTVYRYLFENSRFTTPLQEVVFDGAGQGQFRFKRKDGEEITNKLAISSGLLSEIQSLFNELNFLTSTEDYQHKKDFSHLGVMTITHARNGKERAVKFNYTDNQSLNRLAEIFRNIASQETRFFEIEIVRESDPISVPAQMRLLEDDFRSKRVADPQRFVALLQEIKLDEGVPLIARNHAERLLQMIRKGK